MNSATSLSVAGRTAGWSRYLKDCNAFIIDNTVIRYFLKEVWIVSEAEQLTDVVIRITTITELVVVVADSNQLTDKGCNGKECATVHA